MLDVSECYKTLDAAGPTIFAQIAMAPEVHPAGRAPFRNLGGFCVISYASGRIRHKGCLGESFQ
jgi:hypothetical protein